MNTLSRSVVFALVGLLGFGCQLSVLHLLVGAGLPVAVGTTVAVLAAVAHNFLWHRTWTWRDRAGLPQAQFLRFVGLNGVVSLAGNVAITSSLSASGVPGLAANAVAVVVCSLANFVLADRLVFAVASVLLMTSGVADAAVPGPRTLAGWQEYVETTEQRIAAEEPNPSAGAPTADQWRRLRGGALLLSQRQTRRDGAAMTVPDGAVHHWVGRVFLPGARLNDLLAELQAPTSRRWLPAEVRSLRVAADGQGGLRVFMRVERDSLVDVTYDIEHAVRYARQPAGHATSRSMSRRIVQLDAPGTADERRLPEGDDYGFLWRLNAYWRYLPVDGGVLVECESLALSRSVPTMLRPLAAPMVAKVSRESLENTLAALRAGFAAGEVSGDSDTR